jgi:hypothetical protein
MRRDRPQKNSVAGRCEVKKIFNKDLTTPVFKQIKETIEPMINKTKVLVFDKNCKDGWELTATVVSLNADNPDNPTKLDASVSITGMSFDKSVRTINATGEGKVSDVRLKTLEADAKALVGGVFKDLMEKRVIPALTK